MYTYKTSNNKIVNEPDLYAMPDDTTAEAGVIASFARQIAAKEAETFGEINALAETLPNRVTVEIARISA